MSKIPFSVPAHVWALGDHSLGAWPSTAWEDAAQNPDSWIIAFESPSDAFADELARWQRERANDLGIADPQTGSLLEIKRFADGARLYPHAHALVPEGVFVASSDGQSARFIRQDPPSDDDVALVVSRVEQRLTRVLARWRARRQRDSAMDSDAADILPACAEVPRKLRPRAPPRCVF